MVPELCIPYSEVNPKYRLGPVVDPYNILITHCAECGADTGFDGKCILGFADWKGFGVVVRQCPKCFEKWWHHCDRPYYKTIALMMKLNEEGR